ncbi:MAG: DUF2800 domain-containing protein [Bacillota bacterium]|nr:DUF2800 domain-containing protein [Bacillota bacterium]
MGEHALLSASSSHRWLHCTPSARLEEKLPESSSQYAEEGSLAHEIAELKLRKYCIEPMGARAFNARIKKFKENPLFQEEMLKHTDTYLDYIAGVLHGFSSPPYVAAEKKIDYSSYAPDGFGTGDCIIIGGNILHIIDFKYGKGVPVSAKDNPQMKLYALGAYTEYSFLYPIDTVKMTIVQPRLDSISEDSLSIEELLKWGESIKPIAKLAFDGEGEYSTGEHCRFCRAKALCRARADHYLSLEEFHKMKPPLISKEEVGEILKRAQELSAWVKSLEEFALSECLQGNEVSGWKLVEGRAVRQFVNQEEAFKVLMDNGFEETMLYERKPLTLTETEKLVGKTKFKELLSAYIHTPPGKPTLALKEDKRETFKRLTAAEAFAEVGK